MKCCRLIHNKDLIAEWYAFQVRMARQKLSIEERSRKNLEYQKRRREKINSQPELKEEFLTKERERWRNRMNEGKIKKINNLEEREKRRKRKYWKQAQRESRRWKKRAEEGQQELDTPPHSPLDNSFEEQRSNRQLRAGLRERAKTRKRHSREAKALKDKLDKLAKKADKLRKQLKCREYTQVQVSGTTHQS